MTDTDDATVTITAPDLEVTKEADPNPATTGDVITFTITVENIGDGVAHNATMHDILPANLEFVSFVSLTQGSCIFDSVDTINCELWRYRAGWHRHARVHGDAD